MKRAAVRRRRSGTLSGLITQKIVRSGIIAFLAATGLSVLIAYPNLRRNAVTANETTNEAVVSQIENTLSQIRRYSMILSSSVETNEAVLNYFTDPDDQKYAAAEIALNNLTNYDGQVRAVILLSGDRTPVDSLTNITEKDLDMLKSESITRIQGSPFAQGFSPVYETNMSYMSYTTTAYARNYFVRNRWITLVFLVNLNTMDSSIRTLAADNLDVYYLTDSYGNLFFSTGSDSDLSQARRRAENVPVNQYASLGGDLIFKRTSSTTQYGIVSCVRLSTLLLNLLPYFLMLLVSMIIFLILTILFTQRSVREAIRPVQNLSGHMLLASQGDLDCKVEETDRMDEIGQLERAFNRMIDDLKHSIQVIHDKEAYEQKQRFSLLISQIDPHFINNTVNSINYLARKGRTEDIVRMNTALMTILRDRLRVSDIQITDTVENEIEVVKQYLVIAEFKYTGDLNVEWDISSDLMEEQIPKNMIQPLVENALFHGLIDEETGELKGKLKISLRRQSGMSDTLILSVADDGAGMTEEQLERVRTEHFDPEERGHHIGISNIRGRLYYLYGSEENLRIDSRLHEGTVVTVKLPHEDA